MKKTLLMLSAISLLAIGSCSKSKDEPEQVKNEIAINGTSYSTTVIGNQTWTTVNYNGNGGVNYNDGGNDPRIGKLYSYLELQALSNLPTGWRIPTEEDVKKMMKYLGTSINNSGSDWNGKEYLDAEKTKKIISTTTWSISTLNGNNETGLNIYPVGHYFPYPDPNRPRFTKKGTDGSFWLSTINRESALYLEVSYDQWDTPYNQYPNGTSVLATYISGTSVHIIGFSEKRPIRFIKDN